MKRYITAVVAAAGLVWGTISVFAADPNDASQQPQQGRAIDRAEVPSANNDASANQNQGANTVQGLPSQDQPGRAVDRAQTPSATDPNVSQNQGGNTAQGLPSQTQPGRAYDRAAIGNPAGGYATDEPAGVNESAASIREKASNPTAFVKKAFEADQAEIRLGQLAQEKSSNDQVKMLAQHMVQDHQAHADKVQQLAQQKNIEVSNQLGTDCQKKVDALSAMNGASFDKHYVRDMVRDHKKAIALYEQAAANNTDPDVKALAQSTLPTLKEHLQMAERDATTINEPAGASLHNQ